MILEIVLGAPGADPGFLECWFMGVRFADLISYFHDNEITDQII